MFKASDYRISPFAVESVLLEHPAVAEAAVVPSPDPLRLAVPKAYVVLAEGYHPNKVAARLIFEHSRDRLAPYQRIRRLEFGAAAQDHLRQDPPGGAARSGGSKLHGDGAAEAHRRRCRVPDRGLPRAALTRSGMAGLTTVRSMSYIEVAGRRTWHETSGSGAPVVLLHGAFGGASSWTAQRPRWWTPASRSTCRSVADKCIPRDVPGP